MKLKKNDEVLITAGKDRGKRGKIEKIYPKTAKALVSGLNLYKRHLKKRDEKNPGGIISIPRPLSMSKISLVCPLCSKISRVGYEIDKKGDKKRVCKKCGKII